MNVSEKSKQIIDSCRFCWMCRHICPIGNATGQERNTARARALALSMVLRGSVDLTEDIMDNVYECACCSACTKECVTGWDPVVFTKEVRLKAAMEEKTPEYIRKLIDNCMNAGNPYGETLLDEELKRAMEKHSDKTSLLFYLGSDARYRAPKEAIRAITLLEHAGISFTVLEEEPDSGAAMDYLVGAAQETSQMMQKAAAIMNEYDMVVIYEPSDAKVIYREYKEWNVEMKAERITFPSYIKMLLDEGKLKVSKSEKIVTYQDPFVLARELEETQDARTVISSCAQLKEMLLSHKDTMMAGNLLMAEYMPEIIKKTAVRRVEEARECGADYIVTASVSEYTSMKAAAERNMKIVSLEELVLNSLEGGAAGC